MEQVCQRWLLRSLKYALTPLLILLLALPINANTSTTIIESCYDGDTCTTAEGEKIRLACIDTPELKGKRADPIPAKASRDYLNGLVASEKVDIRRITKDKYGRFVAELSKNGVNLQELMVVKGHARIYKKYAYQCQWTG